MFDHKKMLNDVGKICRIIDSSRTIPHLKACRIVVFNFENLWLSKRKTPKILIDSYIIYLMNHFNLKLAKIMCRE